MTGNSQKTKFTEFKYRFYLFSLLLFQKEIVVLYSKCNYDKKGIGFYMLFVGD